MAADREPRLLEVGVVARPHGVRGEVVVRLLDDDSGRLTPGSVLRSEAGRLEVVAARRHGPGWLVRFAGVDDRAAADRLRGMRLLAEPPPLDTGRGALWVHHLVGARVVDTGGCDRGRVEAVEANPAADLLVLDTGALVPLTFVVEVTAGDADRLAEVRVDPPPGLFE